jgi:hypothetical protein
LKREIEMFIRQGKLKKFVVGSKDVGNYSWKLGKEEPWTKLTTLEILKGFRVNK